MGKALVGVVALGLLVGMLVGGVGVRQEALAAETVAIVVSPSTIYMGSLGEVVTVHAEIPYSTVDRATLYFNGIEVKSTFADSRGDLVVKFNLADVKAKIAPPSATLTLSGTTKDGVPFAGTDTIRVVAAK